MPEPTDPSEHGDRAWEPLRLTYVGRIDEVLRGGVGKLTATQGDPGEPRKVPSTG